VTGFVIKFLWAICDTYHGKDMIQSSPIEKLTTAVFGFALAVGALSLTAANPKTITDVVGGLVLFSLSFIILVVIWWGTSDIMSKIDQGRPMTIFLNIAVLFFVAIEPYLLNILNINPDLFPLSSTLYGIDMAFLMGLSAALCHQLLKENKSSLTKEQLRHFTISRNNQFICAGLFFFSLIPQFLEWTLAGMSVRILIWFATLAFSLIVSSRNRIK
jgi:uncharacterized membrane protein